MPYDAPFTPIQYSVFYCRPVTVLPPSPQVKGEVKHKVDSTVLIVNPPTSCTSTYWSLVPQLFALSMTDWRVTTGRGVYPLIFQLLMDRPGLHVLLHAKQSQTLEVFNSGNFRIHSCPYVFAVSIAVSTFHCHD